MNRLEKIFISKLKENSNKNISFIDEVAEVLDINYDAAYRRIKNKTMLSLNEAVKLASHFNVSLDDLLNKTLHERKLIVKDSVEMNTINEIEIYFKTFVKNVQQLKDRKNIHIIYSAKDLPIFYFARDPLFAKFKIYTMLYLFNKEHSRNNIHFNSFMIPVSLEKTMKEFGDIYYEFDITEIWNDGILDATINQILFFNEIKLLSYNTAIKLCEKLKNIIIHIEKDSFSGIRSNQSKSKLNIYNSTLLLLNNNVLIQTKKSNVLLLPYILTKYFTIEDQSFINKYIQFLEDQLELATLLSKAGVKERMTFFKTKYKAIEKAKQHIELIRQFPI
jgi:plasmid maintenance system antidote protein VapI